MFPKNSTERREENDWELDALASAISSFFERKVKGEQGTALARLSRELAVKVGPESVILGLSKQMQSSLIGLPSCGGERG